MKYLTNIFALIILSQFLVFCSQKQEISPSTTTLAYQPLQIVWFNHTNSQPQAFVDGQEIQVYNFKGQWGIIIPDNLSEGTHTLQLNQEAKQTFKVTSKNVNISPVAVITNALQKQDIDNVSELVAGLSEQDQQKLALFLTNNPDILGKMMRKQPSSLMNLNQKATARTLALQEQTTVTVNSPEYWNNTNIILEAGATYQFTASGQWHDANILTDANGFDGNWLMNLFAWLKRDTRGKWFQLIGSIDRNYNLLLGKNITVTVGKTGLLEFFANDASAFYWNNSGSIQVTIKRVM